MSKTNAGVGRVLNGVEFNQEYQDVSFVKLTNSTETHCGLKYQDGYNVDRLGFDHTEYCSQGGMYFVQEKDAGKWIRYNVMDIKDDSGLRQYVQREMMYVRKVTIPDNAQICIEEGKFKTDKFILSQREEIGRIIYEDALTDGNFMLDCVPEKFMDREMCLLAVEKSGYNLKHVPLDLMDRDLCFIAVKEKSLAILYVPLDLIDIEICLEAIRGNYHAMNYIHSSIKNENLYMEAVKINSRAIQYIPTKFRTIELCTEAVKRDNYDYVLCHYVPLDIKQNLDKNLIPIYRRKPKKINDKLQNASSN